MIDRYDAYAEATTSVKVTAAASLTNIETLKTNVTSLLGSALSSYSVDSVMQIVGASAGILNNASSSTTAASVRGTLLTYLSSAVSLQDATSSTVSQQALILSKLTSRSSELSSSGTTSTAYSLVETVAASGASTGIDQTTATALGSSISSLFDTVDANTDASQLSTSVNNVLRGAWASLAPNEDAITIKADNFNASNSVAYAYTLTNSSLSPPRVNSSVTLPSDGLSSLCPEASSTDSIGLSIVGMTDPYGSSNTSVNSNLLRFSLQATSGCKSSRRRLTSSSSSAISVSVATTSSNTGGVSSS